MKAKNFGHMIYFGDSDIPVWDNWKFSPGTTNKALVHINFKILVSVGFFFPDIVE